MKTHTPRPLTRFVLALGCLAGLIFGWQTAVFAHDGGPRLQLTHLAQPGDRVEIGGVNLGTDLVVGVALVRDERRWVLGEALCDGHGDFTQFFTLPAGLPPGVYTVIAIDNSVAGQERIMASAELRLGQPATPVGLWSALIWLAAGVLGLAGSLGVTMIWRRRTAVGPAIPPRPEQQTVIG